MRGHLRRRGKSGLWSVVIDEGRDAATGRRRQRWIPTGTTSKRDAERKLTEVLQQPHGGSLPPPGKLTVADVLRSYIESRKVAGRAPKTILEDDRTAESRIIPAIGHIRATELRPTDLEAHYARELASTDRRRTKQPRQVDPRTVEIQHILLRAAFRHAVKQAFLVRNPTDAVTPPRSAPKEQKVLTPEQAVQLLTYLNGHRLQALVYLAVSTGMREGELIGLRWQDVSLDDAMLYVRVQRQYLPGQGVQEKVTKEHRGARPIELTTEEVAILRRHKAMQVEECRRAGPLWREHGLVFPTEIGTPLNPRNLQRFLDTALRKAELPDIRFHDLRHTAGTFLMREDGRIVVAQRRLGHSRASITLDLYGHALPGDQRAAADKVVAALKRAQIHSAHEG